MALGRLDRATGRPLAEGARGVREAHVLVISRLHRRSDARIRADTEE